MGSVGKRKRPRKLPATWLEEWSRMENAIQESPPTKRHERRIQRHQSDRMRGVQQGQTPDTYKAMFGVDSYPTPIAPDESKLQRNMPLPTWSTGKATDSRS